jgi:hypothetical protein
MGAISKLGVIFLDKVGYSRIIIFCQYNQSDLVPQDRSLTTEITSHVRDTSQMVLQSDEPMLKMGIGAVVCLSLDRR